MPETTQNNRPLPECFYCPHCDTDLTLDTIIYNDNVEVRRYGYANLMHNNGVIDTDINDEETIDTLREEYLCPNCEDEVDIEVKKIRSISAQIQQHVSQYEIRTNEGNRPRLYTIDTIRDDDSAQVTRKGRFTDEIYPLVISMLNEELIPQFNKHHRIYENINEETQEPTPESEKPPEENEPVFEDGNHRRWGNGVNYPSQCQCPECDFSFIENGDDELRCPRCKHIFYKENNNHTIASNGYGIRAMGTF